MIQTRALRQENTTFMMVFYTVGLAVITAVPAIWTWKPVMPLDWGALLAIGLLAQMGQYYFLRAYRIADARVLAPVGYLSILFVTAVGYFLFDEVPEARVVLGIAIIFVSLQATAFAEYLLKKLRGRR